MIRSLAITGALVALGASLHASSDPGDPEGGGGITLTLPDDISVKLFGRVYYDWGWFSGDSPTYNTDGTNLEDGTQFRAARLGAEGTVWESVGYRAEFEFATGDAQLRNVYMHLDTAVGEARAGHFKEPFTLEQATSSRFLTFMERGLADAFAPGFNSGFALFDGNEAGTMTWAAGVFRSTDNSGFDVGDADYGYTGRVTGTPWNEGSGAELLHLGSSVSYRHGEVRFRARPEANLVNQVADSGAIDADGTLLSGLEAAWVQGPFSAQAEYTMAMVDGASGAMDADYSGYYAYLSWFLTGEHRPYQKGSGAFGRVKPSENFGQGNGAFELAMRYSSIDLDDGPSTDTMDDVTLGMNWYLNPNTRVMLNAIHSEFEDGTVDDSADILMMRIQFDF